jgi:hypothetical protein
MYLTRVSLSRRTVLRGLGATLALPLLDAMVPALTAAANTVAKPVRRLGVVYVPNGMAMEYWTPTIEGNAFELTPILQPLAPFREQILVLSGFKLPWAAPHAGGSTPFLTGHAGTDGETDIVCGVSMDQLVAREFGHHTQLASLELAIESKGNSGQCSQGYSCVYLNTISWRDPRTPLPMESNPRIVFEQLFGDAPSTAFAARQARIERRLSILDSVREAVADLTRSIGPSDRVRLDQYLESVRDIERRLQKAEEQRNRELPVIDEPAGSPAAYGEHARLMFDLQLLAYQCDLTRVITFMMGREQSSLTFPQIGVPDSHHPLSHHAYNPEKIAAMSKINTYHVSLFAEYLEKLRSTPDGDGTLLDHLMVLYGGGISDSNAHKHDNLPILLAGGGSGTLAGGRHLRCPDDPPLADLLLTMMEKLGLPLDRLGNSDGTIVIDSDRVVRPI